MLIVGIGLRPIETKRVLILDIGDRNTKCIFASKGTQTTYLK